MDTLKREFITTSDGSKTIFLPDFNETYHSKFGAIQEAQHVFIKYGFNCIDSKNISILEVGFGTGLNALVTKAANEKSDKSIHYFGIEKFPISTLEVEQLNYVSTLEKPNLEPFFNSIHSCKWEENVIIDSDFTLFKNKISLEKFSAKPKFNLVYFDAFGFHYQPQLWTEEIFKKMYDCLLPNSILVTYACRTSIRKAMLAVGFEVEKLPGAPGKREMLRAFKK